MIHRWINSTNNGGQQVAASVAPGQVDWLWTGALKEVLQSRRALLRAVILLAVVVLGVALLLVMTRILELSALPGLVYCAGRRQRTQG